MFARPEKAIIVQTGIPWQGAGCTIPEARRKPPVSIARFARDPKRQKGQFLTPEATAARVLEGLAFSRDQKILEPSFGDGAFLFAAIEGLLPCHAGPRKARLAKIFSENLYGVELDAALFGRFFDALKQRYDFLPERHHLHCGDFFDWFPPGQSSPLTARDYFARQWECFDLIIGNPPFGGSIRANLHDALDDVFGFRLGEKIKKETYSFFLVKSLDLLKDGGSLRFICSDTFLTINTMKGLRKLLMEYGETTIETLEHFSDETNHPMVVVEFCKTSRPCKHVRIDRESLPRTNVERTQNLSWRITPHDARYFTGVTLGDFLVASSGMTIGNNELFLREIQEGTFHEPFRFEFFNEPITLKRELARARLGILSPAQQVKIREQERRGDTRRNVRWVELKRPREVRVPHPDYCYYNKATSDILYAPPRWVVYWKDDGDAVLTFKKNGNWYLHGVGGQPYFLRSGLTWPLIAPRLCMRFLPEGYILDSGAPCAFLREGISVDELYFILGWALTPTCNRLLKNVINHTRNIQGKDFERLPYPAWIDAPAKRKLVAYVRDLVERAMAGTAFDFDHPDVAVLERRYQFRAQQQTNNHALPRRARLRQSLLFEE
jgi:hypothetical protein